jgi:hypothetical protein
MADETRKQAIEWLRDWSKWLITINFAAATGCTVVLEIGVKGPARPFLLLAIGAFSVSVVISIAVVRALSTAIEGLNLSGEHQKSILEHQILHGVSVRTGTRVQFASLIAGVLLFLGWVALKPPPPSTNAAMPMGRANSQTVE